MTTLSGLSQTLVTDGLLEQQIAQQIFNKANQNQQTFIHELLALEILDPEIIAKVACSNFGVPLLELEELDINAIPLDLIDEKLIVKHQVLPLLKRSNVLFIAVGDPSQQLLFNDIGFHTGLYIRCVVVNASKLEKLIDHLIQQKKSNALDEYLGEHDPSLEIAITQDNLDTQEDNSADDAPVVRFVQKILLDAINNSASDIHFEPYENKYRVRFRIDGILYEIASPPNQLSNRIASRLKILSQLDISERRIPQDGRFKLKITAKRSVEFRVSTCPTVNGEKVVMRILDPTAANIGIEMLGMEPEQKTLFLESIHQPQGMVLVTGPTGSGKTVTLYTALNILNTSEKNISTAEDPVEIKIAGINQVNINAKTGLTFSTTLRAFLRQDPDIIMVGEMRDLETAEIGIKAAQTGHLVLSTLHTNNAPETLTRLMNMGVEPFNIATSTSLVIAQRLARRLCTKCKIEDSLPEDTLIKLGLDKQKSLTIFQANPNGCKHCTKGYKGRVGLYEMLRFTDEIAEAILKGSNAFIINEIALKQGMVNLHQSGINKVKAGITSLAEINRVTKD